MNALPCRRQLHPAPPMAGGFTLVELLVVLTVSIILLAAAIPSFSDNLLAVRLGNHTSALAGALQKARSEAIKRNTVISVCASANGSDCAVTGGWEQGWIVLAGSTVLEYQQALPNGHRLGERDGTLRLNFQPTGVGVTPAQFTACRATPQSRLARTLSVSTTGLTTAISTTVDSCP